jgi:GntR family transcriptional regulator of vanillate catabolism
MADNQVMATTSQTLSAVTEDGAQSQTIRAVLGLRGLIIEGALQPGARVLEQMLVDRLGVSRTPARVAMLRVCEEGLLEELPSGGYAVARFSEDDVFDAIAIRGNLEGMAARLAAERGVSPNLMSKMHRCVQELDGVIVRLETSSDLTDYVRLNDRFHDLLYEAAQSPMLKRSLERLVVLPFAAPNAFVSVTQSDSAAVRSVLVVSQEQHRSIVDAIERREGTRAESITIEHSRSAWKYLRLILSTDTDALRLAGLNLVVADKVSGTR